jgi:hypothetical protein
MAEGAEAHDLRLDELDVPEPESRAEQVDKMFIDAKKEARSPFKKAFEWLLREEK